MYSTPCLPLIVRDRLTGILAAVTLLCMSALLSAYNPALAVSRGTWPRNKAILASFANGAFALGGAGTRLIRGTGEDILPCRAAKV